MAIVNHENREVTFKLVYAGTPVGGKTTNLSWIHSRIDSGQRGDMVSLATSADRTLYFDFMPVNTVSVNGFKTKFLLYTVPGQIQYNATRQLVLRGADGIVFVADSSLARLDENLESARTLMRNLRDNQMSLQNIPFVIQFNKRDVADAAPINHLQQVLNNPSAPWPAFESVAKDGVNVFATLNCISQLVLERFWHATNGTQPAPASSAPRHDPGTPAPATTVV